MELEGSLPRSQVPTTCPYNTYVVFPNKYSMFDPNRYGYGTFTNAPRISCCNITQYPQCFLCIAC
jgi:hypothetical protein